MFTCENRYYMRLFFIEMAWDNKNIHICSTMIGDHNVYTFMEWLYGRECVKIC